MYTKTVPHKNFKGQPRNQEVHFNLTAHEVLKLLPEFKSIFDWQEKVSKQDPNGEPDMEEVIEFYTNFEDILLAAWGELDESGDHFRKGGVYDFRESSLFHAAMKLFLEDISELNRLLDGIMPEDLQDIVKNADSNLLEMSKQDNPAAVNAEIERLRAELAKSKGETQS